METVKQLKEILENDLQSFEYCLDNKGAWSTPDGIKDLFIGMIETKNALQKYLTEFETAINARTQPTPENFPDTWETEWQPSFDAATPETIARDAAMETMLQELAGDEAQELRLKQAFDEAALALSLIHISEPTRPY